MNAPESIPQDQSPPARATVLRAHPALPSSQQWRINSLIDAMPVDWFQIDDMPQLIELARHMDRAERILNHLQKVPSKDNFTRRALSELVVAEESRIQALSVRLRVPSPIAQPRF